MAILEYEERDDVALLTLNRPEVHNAISSALADAMAERLETLGKRRNIRALIVTGAGDRAFSAGTDLKERRLLDAEGKWEQRTRGWRVNRSIRALPQPVIAAIHGWCLGGGFELALFCDFRIATEQAVFGFPEMTLGAYPGSGGPIMLPRLIGRARAKDLLFTGRRIGAVEAERLGVVGQIVPREELLSRAFALAEGFKATSPLGLAAVKQLVDEGADLDFEAASALNDRLRRPLEATRDYEEGIRAFFEKRAPHFRGE